MTEDGHEWFPAQATGRTKGNTMVLLFGAEFSPGSPHNLVEWIATANDAVLPSGRHQVQSVAQAARGPSTRKQQLQGQPDTPRALPLEPPKELSAIGFAPSARHYN
jgi:hypothetical protein